MLLAKIVGTAVATIKTPELTGVKLLVVQPLNERLEPIDRLNVAVDTVQAGYGDIVVLVRSREASLALEVKGTPTDLATVGVVERLDIDETDGVFELPSGLSRFA